MSNIRALRNNKIRCMLSVILLSVFVAGSALAWWGGDKDDDKKAVQRRVIRRSAANIVFERGVLDQSFGSQWLLGDTPLVFVKKSKVSCQGEYDRESYLEAGREALVIGVKRGGVLIVRRVLMISPDRSMQRGMYGGSRVYSEPQRAPANAPR
jgi:hypothetical protein